MNRRGFLKTTALSTAALMSKHGAYAQSVPSERVRVALMGCHAKGRGFQLMKAVLGLPNVEIATVCDVDARAMDAATAEIVAQTQRTPKREKDLRKLLEDRELDGVICAAPDHWHAPAALLTMKASKAIYVEKPVSHNPCEGEILAEAAVKHRTVFQMGNQRRSSVVYQAAIKEIHGGLIGEPRFARCWYATQRVPIGKGKPVPVPEWLDWDLWQGPAPRREFRDNRVPYNWHWLRHWGTGECGNNATHYVDVARWALNAVFPSRVTSAGGRLFYEGDDWEWFDTQAATFEFPGNKLMTWDGLSSVKARPYEGASTGCMIYGLDGAVLFTPDNVCTLFDKAGKKLREWNDKDTTADATNRTNPAAGLDIAHLANWASCIRNKDLNTPSPAAEAHASTLLTHLANIAQLTGETVRIDPATGKLAKGSAGAELWSRTYESGWEMKV